MTYIVLKAPLNSNQPTSCVACFRSVGFSFFSTSQDIGWKERLQNDLYSVEWDVKH